MNAQRILFVLAAALFVGAVGLATASPKMASLGAVIGWVNANGVENIHRWAMRIGGAWTWVWIVQPLMVRPAWLPLGSLGLICAAAALSVPPKDATRRSHRRS